MKKFLALILALAMVFAFAACGGGNTDGDDVNVKGEGVMTYAQYVEAELESEVVIEAYVQAKQILNTEYQNTSLYLADADGAYFVYRVACTEEEYAKLEVGTKVKVTGYKSAWAGEVEIIDAKFEVLEGKYTVSAKDVTELLGKDELIDSQNQLVSFKGMTVAPSTDPEGNEVAFLYNWDGSGQEGSDLYFNVSIGEATYNFLVETDLCGADSDVYKAAQNLKVGDKIDLEGFLYWYEGINPHITSIKAAA